MTDTVKRAADAMEAKRAELIAKPLARIWPDLARAVISAMQEWSPIEEAPKDGREVLVTGFIYNDQKRGRWYETAAWNGSEWATEFAPVHPPTHWMPLPSPPEGE